MVVSAPVPASQRPATASRARRVITSFAVFALLVILPNVAYRVALDHSSPFLRDPEYGHHLSLLRARMAEHPARPPVLVIGSSRTGMGFRPDAGEPAAESDPLLFNFSLSGGGPVMQAFTVRRLHADGFAPAGVVLEFWPALMRGDIVVREDGHLDNYHEQGRIDPPRLRDCDRQSVREFFWAPDAAWAARYGDSALPLYALRQPILNQLAPALVPQGQRTDRAWRTADAWGWWPAWDYVTQERMDAGWPDVEKAYGPRYAGFSIHPQHAAAFRAAVAELRQRGVPVLILRMPESDRFRTLQTPEGEKLADEFLRGVTDEYGLEVLDARRWAEADELPDGFHLTTRGAERVSRRLIADVRAWWAKQRSTR